MNSYKKKIYTIIIIHGSKKKTWIKFFKKLKILIKKKIFNLNKIFISFINKKKPYLIKIINKGMRKSILNYLILPLFLGKGKHLKYDLKKIILNIIYIYNNINFFYLNIINKKNIINLIKINYFIKLKKIIKIL